MTKLINAMQIKSWTMQFISHHSTLAWIYHAIFISNLGPEFGPIPQAKRFSLHSIKI